MGGSESSPGASDKRSTNKDGDTPAEAADTSGAGAKRPGFSEEEDDAQNQKKVKTGDNLPASNEAGAPPAAPNNEQQPNANDNDDDPTKQPSQVAPATPGNQPIGGEGVPQSQPGSGVGMPPQAMQQQMMGYGPPGPGMMHGQYPPGAMMQAYAPYGPPPPHGYQGQPPPHYQQQQPNNAPPGINQTPNTGAPNQMQQQQQQQPGQSMPSQQQQPPGTYGQPGPTDGDGSQPQGTPGGGASHQGGNNPNNRGAPPPHGQFPPGMMPGPHNPMQMHMMQYGPPGMFYPGMMNPMMAQAAGFHHPNHPGAMMGGGSKPNPHQQSYMQAPPPRSAGIALALSCDDEQLSEYQMLVRKQLEIFEAQGEDVESNTQGRKKQVVLLQVGIRCRHCAGFPLRQRGRGAVYYPAKLHGVYQASQNMASSHLCESCQCIPPPLKAELRSLRDRRDTASGGKQYWADGARAMGLHETEEGLRLRRPDHRAAAQSPTQQHNEAI